MPENWLLYPYLYINCQSIKTIRSTKNFLYIITHHKFPFEYPKVAAHRQLEQKAFKSKGTSF